MSAPRVRWPTKVLGSPPTRREIDTVCTLVSLAGRDLLEPTGDQERLSLANDWYAWSEKQTNREKTAGALRAAYWYRQTLASLSGLEKTRVEKLIAEIEKSSGPFAKERWVELLDRTDLSRHKIEGVWERAAFLLESSGKTSWQTIALPVHIDSGSYELEVCLTNFSEELGIFCPGPEYPVEMAINCWFNAKTALGGIDKQEGKLSPSAVPAYKFDPQKIYFLNLRVERSAGLASYTLTINGKSYYVWKGRESSLFAGYQNNKHRLLIVSKRPQLSMLSARFRLLSNGVARFDTP